MKLKEMIFEALADERVCSVLSEVITEKVLNIEPEDSFSIECVDLSEHGGTQLGDYPSIMSAIKDTITNDILKEKIQINDMEM